MTRMDFMCPNGAKASNRWASVVFGSSSLTYRVQSGGSIVREEPGVDAGPEPDPLWEGLKLLLERESECFCDNCGFGCEI